MKDSGQCHAELEHISTALQQPVAIISGMPDSYGDIVVAAMEGNRIGRQLAQAQNFEDALFFAARKVREGC